MKIRIGQLPGKIDTISLPDNATAGDAIRIGKEKDIIRDKRRSPEIRIDGKTADPDTRIKDGDTVLLTEPIHGFGPAGPRRNITLKIDGHYADEDVEIIKQEIENILNGFCCKGAKNATLLHLTEFTWDIKNVSDGDKSFGVREDSKKKEVSHFEISFEKYMEMTTLKTLIPIASLR